MAMAQCAICGEDQGAATSLLPQVKSMRWLASMIIYCTGTAVMHPSGKIKMEQAWRTDGRRLSLIAKTSALHCIACLQLALLSPHPQ